MIRYVPYLLLANLVFDSSVAHLCRESEREGDRERGKYPKLENYIKIIVNQIDASSIVNSYISLNKNKNLNKIKTKKIFDNKPKLINGTIAFMKRGFDSIGEPTSQ